MPGESSGPARPDVGGGRSLPGVGPGRGPDVVGAVGYGRRDQVRLV